MILRDDEILTGFSGRSRRRNIGEERGREAQRFLDFIADPGDNTRSPIPTLRGFSGAVCWMDGRERKSLLLFPLFFLNEMGTIEIFFFLFRNKVSVSNIFHCIKNS